MADTRTPQQRRRIMQAVKGKNTNPELVVRRLLHGMGYRYGLHVRALPGTPDIVLTRLKKVVLVHGCFWHAHGCKKGQPPKSRRGYWLPKLADNKRRDSAKRAALKALGWDVLVVWQCETKALPKLEKRLSRFVEN